MTLLLTNTVMVTKKTMTSVDKTTLNFPLSSSIMSNNYFLFVFIFSRVYSLHTGNIIISIIINNYTIYIKLILIY